MIRAKETEKELEANKKKAVKQMIEWQVKDEESQNAFLQNMMSVVDRVKHQPLTDQDSRY